MRYRQPTPSAPAFACLFAVCGFFASASAWSSAAQERLVEQYLKASAGGATAMVEFYLPADVEEFRGTVLKALEDEGRQSDSAIRERLFGAGTTLDSLRRMTPPTFLLAATRSVPLPVVPARKIEVLGIVEEGKRVHAVARAWSDEKGNGPSRLTLVTLAAYGKDWRVALPENFRARVESLIAGDSGERAAAAAPAAPATPNTPEIVTLLDNAAQALRAGNCATFFSVYYSPNFRRTKSESAFKTLVSKCTTSIDIRETYLMPLELAKRLTPRYENDGARVVYDMRGQGLPFPYFALEKVDERWFIAE
jgi:hypothetical protein